MAYQIYRHINKILLSFIDILYILFNLRTSQFSWPLKNGGLFTIVIRTPAIFIHDTVIHDTVIHDTVILDIVILDVVILVIVTPDILHNVLGCESGGGIVDQESRDQGADGGAGGQQLSQTRPLHHQPHL